MQDIFPIFYVLSCSLVCGAADFCLEVVEAEYRTYIESIQNLS
jgi:hypothetical protein